MSARAARRQSARPLVTPQPDGSTNILWSLGTLPTTTVANRTIVLTATTPGIDGGTETFTNTATLNGTGPAGVPITSGLKTALVEHHAAGARHQ